MAKKRKKTSFWTIALTAVVTAGAALGAIKLFGVPSELRPEDEVPLKVINKVTADDLIENAIYSNKTYSDVGKNFFEENFDYFFDNESHVMIKNVKTINSFSDAPEYLFKDSRELIKENAPNYNQYVYAGKKLSLVRFNYTDNKGVSQSEIVVPNYSLLSNIGENSLKNLGLSNFSNNYSTKDLFYSSFSADFLGSGDKVISIDFIADLESEENKKFNESDHTIKSVGKVDFRNKKNNEELTEEDFVKLVNANKKIVNKMESESEDYFSDLSLNQGGLMIGDISMLGDESGNPYGACYFNFDEAFEFDFAKIKVKGYEEKGEESASALGYGSSRYYCDNNIMDTSKSSDESFFGILSSESNSTNFKFSGYRCPVILEIEFFTIEEVK